MAAQEPLNDLEVIQTDTKTWRISFKSAGVPIDITDYVLFFTVKVTLTDLDVNAKISKTIVCPNNADSQAGLGFIALSSTDTNIAVGNYVYDMKYQVNAGDIIMVGNRSWLGIAIRLITRSRWNHCGVFISSTEVIEATYKGVFQSNVSKFLDMAKNGHGCYNIYRVKTIDENQMNTVIKFVQNQLGAKYDNMQFARVLLMLLLKIPRKIQFHDPARKWLCSELVAEAFEAAGILFSNKIKPDNTIPGDISKSSIVEKIF